ncbi:xylulokinase [Alkalicoccobacillus murimartini]|uniref:Xylulose kinase n=1 Tax=Alkalicoccobacillus murimartini TaxID=171685 RepID=A0ABT9YDS5_9BACI|nr:xylulokinase [Alkalicoccobacillus murimartini]MDQ0206001.1 xylulokinase [Alkalicoccobacillus murimartini]
MSYVIGIDLGTSAVKLLLVSKEGEVKVEVSQSYPLQQVRSGYSEQNPADWLEQTIVGLSELVTQFKGSVDEIKGISFSGQMHGLVLLNKSNEVLRPAILWNDTRTTSQCRQLEQTIGKEDLLRITKNPALEGFTLPKLLWVKEHEPEIFEQTNVFMLPKDYLRYGLTGAIHTEYSDAGGTLLLDIEKQTWSSELLSRLGIDETICPPLVSSHAFVGHVTAQVAEATGLSPQTKVFAGGADNACGAIGAGILSEETTLVSIGTSGVVLSYEKDKETRVDGKVHFFHHAEPGAFYKMGVTLSAGYSLSWFKDTFAKEQDIEQLIREAGEREPGANGLLFTPYLTGERSPHADAAIRASFIGMSSTHTQADFVRAVLEGITFSLKDSIELFREMGTKVEKIISIGGGAKSEVWLQLQANIFNARIVKQTSEQGPGMGAAMLAAFGVGWFDSLETCAEAFLSEQSTYEPDPIQVERYAEMYPLYKDVYTQTKQLNQALTTYR